ALGLVGALFAEFLPGDANLVLTLRGSATTGLRQAFTDRRARLARLGERLARAFHGTVFRQARAVLADRTRIRDRKRARGTGGHRLHAPELVIVHDVTAHDAGLAEHEGHRIAGDPERAREGGIDSRAFLIDARRPDFTRITSLEAVSKIARFT